jgi:hypothetical protein
MTEQRYSGTNRRGWHVNKEVSVGDLVALLLAIAAVILAYSQLDKRVTVLETVPSAQASTDARQDLEARALKNEIGARLDRMEDKIDRLIERTSPRN